MKKLNLIICLTITVLLFSSCSLDDENKEDREITVEMTVYPETGYSAGLFTQDMFAEFLLFSDSDNQRKRILTGATSIYDNLNYEKGYEYRVEAKKIFLSDPPQDGPIVMFEFVRTLSKEKVITENSEEQIEVGVDPNKVTFYPLQGETKQALFIRENQEDNGKPLVAIEGFDYEEGFTYRLSVKKITQAEPYSLKYTLVDILSKEEEE